MVVKYITMSLASHCFIVSQVIVSSSILIDPTLSNYASIIRFNIIFVAFSDELVNSDIIMSHNTSFVVVHTSTLYN